MNNSIIGIQLIKPKRKNTVEYQINIPIESLEFVYKCAKQNHPNKKFKIITSLIINDKKEYEDIKRLGLFPEKYTWNIEDVDLSEFKPSN